jgi:hypothetical protein
MIFLQIQRLSSFSPKTSAQIVPKTLPHLSIEHQTAKTKSLRIGPAMAILILAQHNNQPTISRHGSNYKIIASSLSIDGCIVASFLDLVKIPHHGHVGHGNCASETVLQAIQLILVE